MAPASLGTLLDPSYLDGLTDLPIEEVRSRRDQAVEVETGRSYVRRLIQGRLDILQAELRRRESGEIAGDVAQLVERLPEILGDRVRPPGTGRLSTLMAPADLDVAQVGRLDEIIGIDALAHLPELTEPQVRQASDSLAQYEQEVSADRKALFTVIDRLQDELVRRYKSGEANVDTLLT
ncbi:MAG: aerial mycelium formation protein [Acidimicrobiales bacterium]